MKSEYQALCHFDRSREIFPHEIHAKAALDEAASDKIYTNFKGKHLGFHVHAIGRPTNHDYGQFHLLPIWTSPPSPLMMSCSFIGPNLMPCMTLMMADNTLEKNEQKKP